MTTPTRTYPRTDRQRVLRFIESLGPTSTEAPYLATVFAKKSLSMRDFAILCHFIARRAAENRINPDCIAALGLPSLPNVVRQEATQ